MKRIRPVRQYEDDRHYPAAEGGHEVDGDRRQLMGRLLWGGAAGVVTLFVGGDGSRAGATPSAGEDSGDAVERGRGYHAHTFSLPSPHRFKRCRLTVTKLLVQSRDRRLIAFVKDAKERKGIAAVFEKALDAASCADLTDRRRLAALQRRLGSALAAHYRRRRKRRTARPVITLQIGGGGRRKPHPPPPGVPAHP